MTRALRIEYPGAVYHVICRGNNRQAIFRDDQDRQRYLGKLSVYCQEKKVDLLAYCLMSNHVYVLVEIRSRQRSEAIKLCRELVCYLGRRHGEVGLEELRQYLQVRELSTVSHAVKRAETRLGKESGFRRRRDHILRQLD